MKKFLKRFVACSLSFCAFALIGVLAARAQAAPYDGLLSAELEDATPALQKIPNEYERAATMRLTATALARLGKLDSALKIASSQRDDNESTNTRDEVWRITARRLAWQGNLPAATRCANRISAEYSRADALLSIARADLRNGDTDAARIILKSVTPTIRQIKSSYALSYLAYLFARVGDSSTARALFIEANKFADGRPLTIPFYQAKAGQSQDIWSRKNIEIMSQDTFSLLPARFVFAAHHNWQPLLDFAVQLPVLNATTLLLEVCADQLRQGEHQAARSTLALAQSHFSELSEAIQQAKSALSLEIYLALAEIAVGEETAGRARFAALKATPNFSPELDALFYYWLAADPPFVMMHVKPEQQRADERAALAALVKWKNGSNRVADMLDIARLQLKRADMNALHETLQLARGAIRADLVNPLNVGHGRNVEGRRFEAAGRLMKIVKIERDAGEDDSAQSTLAQARTLLQNYSREEVAWTLLRAGLNKEATSLLEQIAIALPTTSARLYYPGRSYFSNGVSTNNLAYLAAVQAKAGDASNALRWVLKIPDTSLRAQCLAAIALALTPTPPEESEFILRGEKERGAQISSHIQLPGYDSSYNFDELMD